MGMDSTTWDKALTNQKVTLQVVDRQAGLNWGWQCRASAGRDLGSGHLVPNWIRRQPLGGQLRRPSQVSEHLGVKPKRLPVGG